MKKINIYLIANELEVEQDKIELGNFVRSLNDKYNKKYEIYFKLINDERLHEQNEDEIKNSELFYIIFCNEMSEENVEKFNIAYDSFLKEHTPKITTYVKNSDKPTGKSVNEFLKKLDKELGHYYSVYDNVDTLKLDFILKLNMLDLKIGRDKIEMETKEGKIYFGQEEVLSIENVSIIANNKKLKELKSEKEEVDNEILKNYEKFKNTNEDSDFQKYLETKEKSKKIGDEIFEIQKDIISVEDSFVRFWANSKLSQRQINAQKSLEKGDLETAKELLNREEILEDATRKIELKRKKIESIDEEIKISVNECLQRAKTLILDKENASRFEEINQTYKDAIQIEKMGGIYRETLITYAYYLFNYEKNYEEAIIYGEKYIKYTEADIVNKKLHDILIVYELLAECYEKINQNDDAERYCKKAIEISGKLIEENAWFLKIKDNTNMQNSTEKAKENHLKYYWYCIDEYYFLLHLYETKYQDKNRELLSCYSILIHMLQWVLELSPGDAIAESCLLYAYNDYEQALNK